MDDDAIAELDVGLRDGGNGLFAGDDTDVVPVRDDAVVLAAGEVGEGLAIIDKRAIDEGLDENGDIGGGRSRVETLEDVVGQEGSDGDGVVLLGDGLAFGNVTGNGGECFVGRRKDGDVG